MLIITSRPLLGRHIFSLLMGVSGLHRSCFRERRNNKLTTMMENFRDCSAKVQVSHDHTSQKLTGLDPGECGSIRTRDSLDYIQVSAVKEAHDMTNFKFEGLIVDLRGVCLSSLSKQTNPDQCHQSSSTSHTHLDLSIEFLAGLLYGQTHWIQSGEFFVGILIVAAHCRPPNSNHTHLDFYPLSFWFLLHWG